MTTHPLLGPDFRWPDFDWPKFLPGWVWLVGAGPGDPGLLTLHAVNALRHAETIIHDGLVAPAILDWANPEAERIAMAKRGGQVSPTQAEISALLVERARAGRRVLRLKGGDPFVFGRGGEEGQVLVRAGIPFRLVPGITAGIGGLGYAGIPVTHGRVNAAVTFVTGHDINGHAPPLDWAAIARASPVIVLYMGMRTLGEIADKLIAAGRGPEEPVALVQNASTPEQKVLETSLARAAAEAESAGFGAPVITCIGRTALLRQALDWQGQATGEALRNPDPLT